MDKIKEEMTREENQILADNVLKPILEIIDLNLPLYDLDRIKLSFKKMHSQYTRVAAFPLPETMRKADEMKSIIDSFKIIIDPMVARQKQKDLKLEQAKGTTGNLILKELGMI